MEKSALLSIIVPVYKAEQYLHRCLDSLCHQTYQNIEIITVNDGSPDNSLNILHEYAEKDNRIIVLDKENGGVNTARELALTKATGEWLTFVDADDWLDCDYIEELMKYTTECQLVCGAFRLDEAGTIYKVKQTAINIDRVSSIETLFETYFGMLYNIWGKLFRRDIIVNNKLGFRSFKREDGILLLDYLQHIDSINIIPTNSYLHYNTQNTSSLTHQKFNGIEKAMLVLYKYHNSFQKLIESDYENYDKYTHVLYLEKTISFCEILHETYSLTFKERLYWYRRMIEQLPKFTLSKYLNRSIHKWLKIAFKMRSPQTINFILRFHLLKNRIRAKLKMY